MSVIRTLCTVLLSLIVMPAGAATAPFNGDRQDTIRAGAATIHVTMRGQGEPIVFIPSLARGVEDFDDMSRRLVQAGYQAILPDPRGIKGSTGPMDGITLHDLANDVAAVIQSHGGGPVTLIGHALGNRVARMVASDHPRLVKQVILLAAGGMVPPSPEMSQAGNRVFEPAVPREERLGALQRFFFAKGNDAKVWQNGWYLNVASAQFAIMNRTRLRDWWAGGSAPILVLQATEDVRTPPENSKLLAAEFPDRVTVVEIPNAGHAMLPEQPERIAAAIVAYLKR